MLVVSDTVVVLDVLLKFVLALDSIVELASDEGEADGTSDDSRIWTGLVASDSLFEMAEAS